MSLLLHRLRFETWRYLPSAQYYASMQSESKLWRRTKSISCYGGVQSESMYRCRMNLSYRGYVVIHAFGYISLIVAFDWINDVTFGNTGSLSFRTYSIPIWKKRKFKLKRGMKKFPWLFQKAHSIFMSRLRHYCQ